MYKRKTTCVLLVIMLLFSWETYAERSEKPIAEGQITLQELNEMGIKAYKEKRYDDAVKFYKQALEQNADDTDVLNNYALVLYKLDRLDESIEASDKALEHAKNSKQRASAAYNKGMALEKEINKTLAEAKLSFVLANAYAPSSTYSAAIEKINRFQLVDKARPVEHAQYQAITKFLKGGAKGGYSYNLGVDEIDLQACQAITDNVNEMQKYDVEWECDFPISGNIYNLSKPQWVEITGEKKKAALDVIKRKEDYRPVYGVSYDVDDRSPLENIYVMPQTKMDCDSSYNSNRLFLWLADENVNSLESRFFSSLEISDQNAVIYHSRIYFVSYNRDGANENNFWISTFMPDNGYAWRPGTTINVCGIKQVKTEKD